MDETWSSDGVRSVLKNSGYPKEKALRWYGQLTFPEFTNVRILRCPHKTSIVERIPHGMSDYGVPISQEEMILAGNSGSQINYGDMTSYSLDFSKSNRDLLDVLGMQIVPCEINFRDRIKKKNHARKLDDIEARVSQFLAKFPECNVEPAYLNDQEELEIRRIESPSLYELMYYRDFLPDFNGTFYPKLLRIFDRLLEESVNCSLRLESDESPLTKEDMNFLREHPYAKLAKAFKVSLGDVKDFYYAYRTARRLSINPKELENAVPSVKKFMNDYNRDERHRIIASDRSPKNRKSRNIDFSRIEDVPLTRELAQIADCVPGAFSLDERIYMLRRMTELWNDKSERQIPIDNDLLKSYLCESFFVSLVNAGVCFDESRRIYFLKEGNKGYFAYALAYQDGKKHCEEAVNLIPSLQEFGLLSSEEAENLRSLLLQGVRRKISGLPAKINDEHEIKIDIETGKVLIYPYATRVIRNIDLL